MKSPGAIAASASTALSATAANAACLSNGEISKLWRAEVVSTLPWAKSASQIGIIHGQECSGHYVTAPGIGRRAYLKPLKLLEDHAQRAVPAREKIASDLAYDLGLPVPPAVLVPSPGSLPAGAVVSLVLYPFQWAWEQVRWLTPDDSVTAAAMNKVLAESAAAMLVFDTWVGQTDHDDHPHNIVWGYDTGDPTVSQIVYLDFARALGCENTWAGGAWTDLVEAPFPRKLRSLATNEAIEQAIDRVLQLSADSIRGVVHRIPNDYLDINQKCIIAEALLGRRDALKSTLL
jgi:hypothetical protein